MVIKKNDEQHLGKDMPIIQRIRNSAGRTYNLIWLFDGLNGITEIPQPEFSRTFRRRLQEELNDHPVDHSCFVYPDDDIRTSQYVGSCGSAAMTVALRHLHPQRIAQDGKRLQPIADFDFVFEKDCLTPELSLSQVIGHDFNAPYYRGRPGYVVWNQMTYYALTNNQVGSFLNLFNNENENDTNFRLFLHCPPSIEHLDFEESRKKKTYEKDRFFIPLQNQDTEIEERLGEILERNHIPIVLVDGLIRSDENHYTFPDDEEEWAKRAKKEHYRPSDCLAVENHPALEELKKLIDANNCDEEQNEREPINYELCHSLNSAYNHLKHELHPTTIGHAVAITGFYVDRYGGNVLWRVIDNNWPTKLNKKTTRMIRDNQGSINYMTTKELVSRMTGDGRDPRILEITSHKKFVLRNEPDKRNLISPVCLDNY